MCRAIACKKCGKTTWAGCGNHVDQVMRSVANKDRCTCKSTASNTVWTEAKAGSGNWFSRLLGK